MRIFHRNKIPFGIITLFTNTTCWNQFHKIVQGYKCTLIGTDLLPGDRLALPTQTSEASITMCIQTHDLICTAPTCFTVDLENSTAMSLVCTSVVLGQPTCLSKEAFLYVGADQLSSSVSQRVARGQCQEQPTL